MTLLVREVTSSVSSSISQTAAQVESRRQRLINYLVFSIVASLYLLPFMRLLLTGTDEGQFISGAARIAQGQVFARDFFEIVGPGTFYWVALFFKLFGVTFVATRGCLFVTSLTTGLLIYFLSCQVCVRYRILPAIILAGTSFGMIWPTVSHHLNSNCVSLAAVACTILWLNSNKTVFLMFAGVLAGVATSFHLPKGIFLLFALIVWVWTQHRQRSVSLSALLWLIAGYGSVVGIITAYFWSQHALWDLFNANYLFPSQHYGAMNSVPYGLGIFEYYWKSWTDASNGVSPAVVMGSILIIPFLVIAALPVLLPIIGIWQRKSFAKPEIALYWLCGWALWLAEYHRKDIWHLVAGSPLLIILLVFYLERDEQRFTNVALQVIAISSVCLALFYCLLALSAHIMVTRVGEVAVFKPDPIVTQLDTRTAPGEEIFVYPDNPIYYFLSETKNPIRLSGLMHDYNNRSEFEDVVRILDQHQVKYVVWDASYNKDVLKMYFPSAKVVRADQLIIETYLESHYKTVWAEGESRLLERKDNDQIR